MKSVAVHAVLAIIGLGWAYRVWTAEDESEGAEEQVTIVDCEPDQVTKLRLTSSDRKTELEVQREGEERRYWVTSVRRPGSSEEERTAFAGGSGVDEYLEQIAPLRATRDLGGDLDAEALEELDLKESRTEIVMTCRGKDHTFHVGGSAFGSGDRYLQNDADKKVYLVAQVLVRELESSEFRLMQRELNAFPMTDVEKLHVRAFEREAKLLQRHRHDPQRAEWVDETEPDKRNELFGNWLDRLARLRVQEYLALDAAPGSDLEGVSAPAHPVLSVVYYGGDGQELGKLEMVRIDAGEEPEFYARTSATRAWVKVLRSVAQQVEDDVRPVVGLEPVVREEPEPEEPTPGSLEALPVPSIESLRQLQPLAPPVPTPGAPTRGAGADGHGAHPGDAHEAPGAGHGDG